MSCSAPTRATGYFPATFEGGSLAAFEVTLSFDYAVAQLVSVAIHFKRNPRDPDPPLYSLTTDNGRITILDDAGPYRFRVEQIQSVPLPAGTYFGTFFLTDADGLTNPGYAPDATWTIEAAS